MFQEQANKRREKRRPWLGAALLLVALLAAYANHFHNSFHFDDAHTIVNNASIRELRNIPLFFRDATTFSALPSNQSYRPLVSTLLAIDYSSRPRPAAILVSSFDLRALRRAHAAARVCHSSSARDAARLRRRNRWIALVAAAWYGLHPANADTINYIIASSEVISTLGVIASFAVYFAFPRLRRYYLYVLPAAIAILAKPTAAIFAVLFAIYWLLFPDSTQTRRTETRLQRIGELSVPFVICGAMLLFVQHMTPHTWIAGAANAHNYLITQPYVALLYFKTFFWPSGLSADYDLNPFATTDDPRFWMGFAFIVLFSVVRDRGCRFQEDAPDRLRSALVSDRASADVALSAGRSDERSSDIPSLHRTRDCDGRRGGVAGRPRGSTYGVGQKSRPCARSCCSFAQTPTLRSNGTRFGKPRKRSGTTSC